MQANLAIAVQMRIRNSKASLCLQEEYKEDSAHTNPVASPESEHYPTPQIWCSSVRMLLTRYKVSRPYATTTKPTLGIP